MKELEEALNNLKIPDNLGWPEDMKVVLKYAQTLLRLVKGEDEKWVIVPREVTQSMKVEYHVEYNQWGQRRNKGKKTSM